MNPEKKYEEFPKFKFSKQDLLGQGRESLSHVFKGLYEGRKEVAVKRIPKHHLKFSENPNRGQHGDYDRHENIARYYMSEEDDNFIYIVMELCSATLEDFIKGMYDGPPVGSDKEILLQIARALEYLHNKAIVNRNIKPEIILISQPDGNYPPKIKLVDFTLSRKLPENQHQLEASEVFTQFGLNAFTAPELLREEKSYTAAVDVFSAGCVFAYVLSRGKHPFGTFSFRIANICMGNLNLRQTLPQIGDETVIDLIEKMLKHKASERIPIHQVPRHPFFWDEGKCLSFIQTACKVLEPLSASKNPSDVSLIGKLQAAKDEIFTGHWPDRLTPHAKQNLFKGVFPMKNKVEVTTSVFFLLKAMRNKFEHYHDVDVAAKDEYGPPPIKYFQYWTERFPRLFIHTWQVMKQSDDPALKKFYESC